MRGIVVGQSGYHSLLLNMNDPVLHASVLLADDDLLKIRVRVSNGEFSGVAEVYVPASHLIDVSAVIGGFPSAASDARTVQLGTFGRSTGGGAVQLRLFCLTRSQRN